MKYTWIFPEKQDSMKNKVSDFYPIALTIAGSDSGGGAGIQADLRTFNAFGVFGCTAITAVTAQNPERVSRIDPIPPEGIRAQIDAVCGRMAVRYAKIGMLGGADAVHAVAEAVKYYKLPAVIDPVMVATSGGKLLQDDAVQVLREELLPLAEWITPNLPEAEILLDRKLKTTEDFQDAARECARRWKVRCFLKTGHASDRKFADDYIAMPDGRLYRLSTPRLEVSECASHGTGCTLSSALAAMFSVDTGWKSAVCEAKAFIYGSLSETAELGKHLRGMYPPVEDYTSQVKLEEVK